MTVEVVLIPDGLTRLPVEARDDSIVWSHLSTVSLSSSPLGSPAAVERRVSGERLVLRLDGKLTDYSATTLDALTGALTNNLSVTKHPDGWQEVQA